MPRSAISTASLNRCASGESNESSTLQFYGRRYLQPRNNARRAAQPHGAARQSAHAGGRVRAGHQPRRDQTLTTVGDDGGIYRWDIANGQEFSVRPDTSGGPEAVSADASVAAVVDAADTGVEVWDVRTGTKVATLSDPDGAQFRRESGIPVLSLDANGQVVSAVDQSGNVYVWSVPQHKVIAELSYPSQKEDPSFAPYLSPDGRQIAVTGVNELIDVATHTSMPLGATCQATQADETRS
jgi:hypothetical protein